MKQLLITIAAVVLVGCGSSAPDISIHDAAEEGNIEAVKRHLAAGTDVNSRFKKQTPLHFSVISGHKEIAKLLLTNGADVDAKNRDGITPLDSAILEGHPEIADLLRKHGAKSGAEDSVHVAALVGNIEALKQHLAAGADVNMKLEGMTPLLNAAMCDYTEIAEILIANGADVNAKNDPDGWTPLHFAAYDWCSPKWLKLLIANGANVNAKAEAGQTPLDFVIHSKLAGDEKDIQTEAANLLRKHGGKTAEELKAEGK